MPEDLFQRIKEYLKRNGMTQKQFVMGLIEDELERDEALHQNDGEEVANEDEKLEDFEDEEDEVSSEGFDDESDKESEREEEVASSPEM